MADWCREVIARQSVLLGSPGHLPRCKANAVYTGSGPEYSARWSAIVQDDSNTMRAGSCQSGKPLVSVVIPAYNVARYIGDAVQSVLDQDYDRKEIIVVDDGSTDDTREVLERFGARIRLERQENAGSAVARNRGVSAAAGEYIAFLDGDDVWLPGKLRAQVAYMEAHPDVGCTCTRWVEWRRSGDAFPPLDRLVQLPAPAGERIRPIPEESGWLYHRILTEFLVWTSTVMVRRCTLEEAGPFNPDLRRGQDFDYWIRLSRLTPIHKLDAIFAAYRLHGAGTTVSCPSRNYAVEIIENAVAKWGLVGPDGTRVDPRVFHKHLGALWCGYGAKQLRAGSPGRAVSSLSMAICHDPLAFRAWYLFCASLVDLVGFGVLRNVLKRRGRALAKGV